MQTFLLCKTTQDKLNWTLITIIIIIARSYIAHFHCDSFHALRPLLSLPSGNHQNYFASSRRQPANVHNLSDIKLWYPHNSYPYIAWVDEASVTSIVVQGHKHVGANGARTHNLPFMSPAESCSVPLDHTRIRHYFTIFFSSISLIMLKVDDNFQIRKKYPKKFPYV